LRTSRINLSEFRKAKTGRHASMCGGKALTNSQKAGGRISMTVKINIAPGSGWGCPQ